MISGNLEYLMTSLPHLRFDAREQEKKRVQSTLQQYSHNNNGELSAVSILENLAKDYLSKPKYQLFQTISLSNIHSTHFREHNNKMIAQFASFRYDLMEKLRRLRHSKGNQNESAIKSDAITEGLVGTPLDQEIFLLKLQWDKLAELSIGHYSDVLALVIYKLKLLLLSRYWSFDQKRGFQVFLNLTTN